MLKSSSITFVIHAPFHPTSTTVRALQSDLHSTVGRLKLKRDMMGVTARVDLDEGFPWYTQPLRCKQRSQKISWKNKVVLTGPLEYKNKNKSLWRGVEPRSPA